MDKYRMVVDRLITFPQPFPIPQGQWLLTAKGDTLQACSVYFGTRRGKIWVIQR